jgi:hypothetical protein
MRGEFVGVWFETWREIWLPLSDHEEAPEDIFCELYPELVPALKAKPSVEDLADIIDSPLQSREVFEKTTTSDLAGERLLVVFFEDARAALEDLLGDQLSNSYFNLLTAYIEKFSLRYDLRRPCTQCPTLPGVFVSLVHQLTELGNADANVSKRLRDFREAVQDLRLGQTEGRITNCVAKQVMLLEAVAAASGTIVGADLGALCKAIEDWPRAAVRTSLLNLYGFASDFPGLRHSTPSAGMSRDIDMRDMVAVSILLAGFTPYLSSALNPDIVYRGA